LRMLEIPVEIFPDILFRLELPPDRWIESS